jgi:ferrochelatase
MNPLCESWLVASRSRTADPRVIEVNRVAWWLILNLIILSVRPRRKGRDYDKIWNRDRNESPLKTVTRSQSEKLAETLIQVSPRVVVNWAMRYANPSIESRLKELAAQGCERILLVPLYPQYAAATTATVCDETSRALASMLAGCSALLR